MNFNFIDFKGYCVICSLNSATTNTNEIRWNVSDSDKIQSLCLGSFDFDDVLGGCGGKGEGGIGRLSYISFL